ncbi:MAG: pilus assembly protein PilM, partial [Candidatus Hydrogenedentes bacterium]|nr:pilus assembly protein PilM [Candidatus Hydrogenedentota bacterium]
MIRLSAEEYVPFPAEELITDQCILGKTNEGGSRVLVVFAHRDVVDTHIKLLQAAKLDPEQVYLSTACLASAALAARGEEPGRCAVVNLASGGLEVLVLNEHTLAYGRAVSSQQDWRLREGAEQDVFEELGVELRASLSAYRREAEEGEDVEAVYLCSEWTGVESHCEALSHEIGQDCVPAPFVERLVEHGNEHLSSIPLVSLGAALLAQDRGAVCVQLLPEALKKSRQRAGTKRQFTLVGVLVALVLMALGGVYWQEVRIRQAYIKDLTKRAAAMAPRARGIISKQKQLAILQNQVERTGNAIEMLADLCELFPSTDMNLTRFSFTHREKIEIWGRARSLQAIEKLSQDLSTAGKSTIPQFIRAQQVYEQKVQERNAEVMDFKISIPFPEAEAPPPDTESSVEDAGNE